MSDTPTTESKFVASLNAAGRKAYVRAFLDEFEATFDAAREAKGMTPEHMKEARARGEHLKRLLRLLGYSKRLPVVGGPRGSFSKEVNEDLFDGKPDLPLTPEKHYGIIPTQGDNKDERA